jgi:hypothetical protein
MAATASPKEYLLVEVRTSDGMRPAMLLPKATLKAAWEADPLQGAGGQPQSCEEGLKSLPF